jgi:hypothetical protein
MRPAANIVEVPADAGFGEAVEEEGGPWQQQADGSWEPRPTMLQLPSSSDAARVKLLTTLSVWGVLQRWLPEGSIAWAQSVLAGL